MEWTEVPPILAAVVGVGLLIVAVVNLCSNLLSKAIDKRDARLGDAIDRQGEKFDTHERKNADEHSALGKRIDRVENKIDHVESKIDGVKDLLHEVHTVVVRLDERQQAAEKREQEREKRERDKDK